jgi:hypothetical protein
MPGNDSSALAALLTDGPTEVLCPQCNASLLHIAMKEGSPTLTCPKCDAPEDREQPAPPSKP